MGNFKRRRGRHRPLVSLALDPRSTSRGAAQRDSDDVGGDGDDDDGGGGGDIR